MKGCSIDESSPSSAGSSSITSSQSEPGSYNDPRSTSSLGELEELEEPSIEGSGDADVGSNWTDIYELVEERGDMPDAADAADAAEDAGEALGVAEVGERTAETLDLLLCLSKMMTARRRLVLDKEFVC